jgi:hypothetical protein
MKKPSKIMQTIVQRTSEPQSAVGLNLLQIRQDDLINIEDRLGIDFDGEDDTEREPEAVVITTDGDDINDGDDESSVEVPLKELAATFMDILLHYTSKKETITCPSCEADPWTTEESKTKVYKKQHIVNGHLASKFQSGRETFIGSTNLTMVMEISNVPKDATPHSLPSNISWNTFESPRQILKIGARSRGREDC